MKRLTTGTLHPAFATPETLQVRRMVEIARTLNRAIQIVVRSHNVEEANLLEREGAGTVFVGENELAKSMVRHLLKSSVFRWLDHCDLWRTERTNSAAAARRRPDCRWRSLVCVSRVTVFSDAAHR